MPATKDETPRYFRKLKTRHRLPDKLSDCLELALEDLSICEKDPRYSIYMPEWHKEYVDGTCEVCLAGAVMAQTCKVPPSVFASPDSFRDDHDRSRLYALNYLRAGLIATALSWTYAPKPVECPDEIEVANYSDNPRQFKADMRKLVKLLRKHGL